VYAIDFFGLGLYNLTSDYISVCHNSTCSFSAKRTLYTIELPGSASTKCRTNDVTFSDLLVNTKYNYINDINEEAACRIRSKYVASYEGVRARESSALVSSFYTTGLLT